jgi:predicted AlkP superfamily phosphohydrolase/phosphomutase
MPFTKILFLGIDAGDKNVIEQGSRDGALPTFRDLLSRGLVGDTTSLEGFFVGATWPSFATGVDPSKHGIHSLVQLRPHTYDLYRVDTRKVIKHSPFWEYLSKAGCNVGILDIPLAGIFPGLQGMQLVEWGVHDGIYGFSAWPPGLKREVLANFGKHPLTYPCDYYSQSSKGFGYFRNLLMKGASLKADLTRYYLKQGGWDFFAQVFSECHCVGHQCWHLHDTNHPGYEADHASITGDPVMDVYSSVDAALGEIISQVDEKTLVIILASHRMSHYYGMPFLLPKILCGLQVAKPLVAEKGSVAQVSHPIDSFQHMLSKIWQYTPIKYKIKMEKARNVVLDWFTRHQPPRTPSFYGVDPWSSKCFILFNGSPISGLRVNLAGREPAGLVKPGPEFEEFYHQLKNDLLDIVDLDTGKPVISGVKKTKDLYKGRYLDHLPDLLIEWNEEKRLGSTQLGNPNGSKVRVGSKKVGKLEGLSTYCRTGDHRPEGLFVAVGAGLKPGHIGQTVSIMDFAPTISELLNVKLPEVDGRPIAEIINNIHF